MTLGGFTSDVVPEGDPQMGGLTSSDVAPEGAYGVKVGSIVGFVKYDGEDNHRITQLGTVSAMADQGHITVENDAGEWVLDRELGDAWGLLEEPET